MNHLKRILCIGFAVVGMEAFAADVSGDAKALEGMWKPVKAELAGQPMSEDIVKSISLKLEGGKYEVLVGDKPDKGTYSIDTATKPHGMTVVGTEGPNHGKTFPAIYELKGDTLRICYDLSGAKRPTEFKSVPGTKLYLVTYLRGKT
ncbi:MAG TPA: TIGR03067 domain-containing protein [Candidatus Dormibacteraeota bacterium]|nr:TIGR03067 domain-containing protein [Candidatus Dormibacteraeota bacterium]